MSRLSELLRQVALKDEQLARDLQRETEVLTERLAFGLNFERHVPEAVELPGRPVRKNDKVHILPPRGEMPTAANDVLWRVDRFEQTADGKLAHLVLQSDPETTETALVDDLVVVAEFRDPIYPGLVSTGKVERGGDKPFHTVINAENFHALQALLFTHRGKVDAIYIDPPYNTGAKDWKYNNDYVEGDDLYRHSKWLAFMERRLLLAKELLNPDDSVLIVTIDEKEYLRLGLLLEQIFPEAKLQMISSITNPKGVVRGSEFARVNEYVFVAMLGGVEIAPEVGDDTGEALRVNWQPLRRSDIDSARHGSTFRPNQFYPIYVDRQTSRIEAIGSPLGREDDRASAPSMPGCDTVFPIRPDGTEIVWGVSDSTLRSLLEKGYVTSGKRSPDKPQQWSIGYLTSGRVKDIESGAARIVGRNQDGSVIATYESAAGRRKMPTNQWQRPSHNAQHYGTILLQQILPGRRFPFPKSLYAVEDCLRFFVSTKPAAVVVDFFVGSGTTVHAVMRLNRQDAGRRQSIGITNNEVSSVEQAELRAAGLRPGDSEWEELGICDHVTRPRVTAAATGLTISGEPIDGGYKFADEFPMADGFEENIEFFTLTYESAMRVASHREFAKIAPFLWLRAGARGRRIDDISKGWDVADAYGVIADLDQTEPFLKAIYSADAVTHAFVVTDEDRLFQAVVRQLPSHVEPVRLYEAYLRNFEIEAGRATR